MNDLGIDLGNNLLGTNDPRIFHGLALCYIAKAYNKASNVTAKVFSDRFDQIIIRQIVRLLDKSEQGYLDLLSETSCEPVKNMIYKTLIGVYNSAADCYVRKYTNGNRLDKTSLDKAKNYIKKIKSATMMLKLEYEGLPIPNNTEAEIEYYECLYFLTVGDKDEALRKITFADERFRQSDSKVSTMHKGFYDIGKDIKNLRKQLEQ
jgi:hypothetical protein